MTPQMIIWLVNLGLSLPDLAIKVQKLFLTQNPTQSDWDVIWEEVKKSPQQYLAEARARLASNETGTTTLPSALSPPTT